MDEDMAYFVGLLVARGTLEDGTNRRLIIQFPYSDLKATGITTSFDQQTSIQLGVTNIRVRLSDLLDTDLQMVSHESSIDLVGTFVRRSMVWRYILLVTQGRKTYREFRVPEIFLQAETPSEWKRQFVKGYGDAAGNVRKANNYMGQWHRVRLDTLNYRTNWAVPVQLCTMLQEHLGLAVHMITWGHPNMNRDFREHQLNIFAEEYLKIGFSFKHKQQFSKSLPIGTLRMLPHMA